MLLACCTVHVYQLISAFKEIHRFLLLRGYKVNVYVIM